MQNNTRSILEELESMYVASDKKYIICSRAENLIESAGRLLDLVAEAYTEEEAENLTRKFLNSIRTRDGRKFQRSLKKVNESQ
jgi:predicted transcriptional regulator